MSVTYSPPFTERSARFADADVHFGVGLLLSREAEAVDNRDFAEWLRLVEKDYTYQVPVPRTPDNPFAPHYDARTMLIDESRWSLESQWFKRLDPNIYELSWAENPPVRFRHVIGNIRVRLTDDPTLLDVRSNVLLVGTRQSDAPKYLSAERIDAVRVQGAEYKLAQRWAVLDQTVIDFPQLRIML